MFPPKLLFSTLHCITQLVSSSCAVKRTKAKAYYSPINHLFQLMGQQEKTVAVVEATTWEGKLMAWFSSTKAPCTPATVLKRHPLNLFFFFFFFCFFSPHACDGVEMLDRLRRATTSQYLTWEYFSQQNASIIFLMAGRMKHGDATQQNYFPKANAVKPKHSTPVLDSSTDVSSWLIEKIAQRVEGFYRLNRCLDSREIVTQISLLVNSDNSFEGDCPMWLAIKTQVVRFIQQPGQFAARTKKKKKKKIRISVVFCLDQIFLPDDGHKS